MNKYLLAAIIIIGLGTAYYFLYQYNYNEAKDTMSLVMPNYMLVYAQSQQGNLTIYENKDYNFTVGYPSINWTVQEYNLAPHEVVRFKGPEINDEIVVRIETMPTVPGVIYTKNIHEIAGESDFAGVKENMEGIRSIESVNTTLAGFPAIQEMYYDSTSYTNLKVLETITLTNGTNVDMISIKYMSDPQYFDRDLPFVYEMIRSFKIGL